MSTEDTAVIPDAPPEGAGPPSIDDIASRAIEAAHQRAADRADGKDVPDALPTLTIPVKRDSQGKFAPQPKPPADAGPARAAEPGAGEPARDAPKTDAAPAAAAADAAPALQPHPRWSEADKATFATLPRDAQQALLGWSQRQDADYTRKTTELAEQRRQLEPLVGPLREHGEFLQGVSQQLGQPVDRTMSNVFGLYRQLVTGQPHEKAQALGYVAQLAGIDLRSLAGAQGQPQMQAPQGQQMQTDPALARELQQLRQQQAEFQRFQRGVVQEREQQSVSVAQRQIEAFRDAKDEQGQPKHPYFAAVAPAMAPLMEGGMTLDEAYAQASQPIAAHWQAREAAAQQARQASEVQARETAAAAERERSAQVDRARRAGGPRPAPSRPGLTESRDVSANAWEAMKKVGLAS